MPPARLFRLLVILTPTFAVVGGAGVLAARNWDAPVPPQSSETAATKGKLIVVAVFDQFRGDYPDRFREAFGPDGFEKLRTAGAYYPNVRVPYAATSTGPGHAAIATGAPPSVTGIVENDWFERGRDKPVAACKADRPYDRVPAGSAAPSTDGGLAPVRLLVPTVGDALLKANPANRVFALSLKDRSAVLLGGTDRNAGVYCFDTDDGEFHTSAFYRDRPHGFVETFNAARVADKWAGKTWDRLGEKPLYDRLAGPDDAPGEGSAPDGSDRTFPHALPPSGRAYYSELERTPFGNELLWELARTAIATETLGRGPGVDLLYLSFSASDLVGHRYGPDSHEVLDCAARADRLIAAMIAELDAAVGPGNYTLIVTADHGVAPLPETGKNPGARRVSPGDVVAGLDAVLDDTFGKKDGQPGQWFEFDFRATQPWVYLNRRQADAVGVEYPAVEKFAAQWLGNRTGVQTAFPRSAVAGKPADGTLGLVQQSFHPDRCGDVYVVVEMYCLFDARPRGTNHGTPHDYDTTVPLFLYGAGVTPAKPGAVTLLAVAPLVCRFAGIEPPDTCIAKAP